VKLLPDFLCTIPRKYGFFLECKRSTIDSKSYSFALDEFKLQKQLAKTFDIKILVVFSDWSGMLKAQWIEKIDIDNCKPYDKNKSKSANGSQKLYILIPKSSLPLFNTILNEL